MHTTYKTDKREPCLLNEVPEGHLIVTTQFICDQLEDTNYNASMPLMVASQKHKLEHKARINTKL